MFVARWPRQPRADTRRRFLVATSAHNVPQIFSAESVKSVVKTDERDRAPPANNRFHTIGCRELPGTNNRSPQRRGPICDECACCRRRRSHHESSHTKNCTRYDECRWQLLGEV